MKNVSTIWNKEFIMLFITNLLVLATFYASIPIIPVYCVEIGITGSKVGIVLTAMSVATVLFRPVAGYLLDNFNLAQEKNIMNYLPYFYFCLVFGMLLSKISTQKAIDNGNHRPLVYASLIILTLTMISFLFLSTGMHMLIAGFFSVWVMVFCSLYFNPLLPAPLLLPSVGSPTLRICSPMMSVSASAHC